MLLLLQIHPLVGRKEVGGGGGGADHSLQILGLLSTFPVSVTNTELLKIAFI